MPEQFTRDMGLTRGEFLRSLPEAIGHPAFRIQGDQIDINDPAGRVSIRLQSSGERRIGMLSLPVTRVVFRFDGLTTRDRDRFMTRFERYFQRGGG